MDVTVKKFIGGRPAFQEKTPILGRSLLSENRSITYLKPTAQSQGIWAYIKRIFQAIWNWLYPCEKLNYVGIVSALDRKTEMNANPLNPQDMLLYFQRFFEKDTASSPVLARCVGQLQEQYQAIAAAAQQSPSAKAKGIKYLEGIKAKLSKLKEGEQSLIVANATPGDELFYLFSRKNQTTSLKIIGRGASIVNLSGIEEVSVAGQAKIVSCLDCGKVDGAFINSLLIFSPLGGQSVSEEALKNLLAGRLLKDPNNLSESVLRTRTNDAFQAVWTALAEVDKNTGHSEGDFQRTHLRLEVFTLFSLLKEYRYSLATNPTEVQTLGRMLRICAESLTKAHEEGLVSRGEVDDLVKELKCVQAAIDVANLSPKPKISSLSMPSMDIYPFKNLTALSAPKAISPKSLQSVKSPRIPNLAPPKSSLSSQELVRKQVSLIVKVMPIDEHLERLVKGATAQQIVQGIYDLKFDVFTEIFRQINTESEWDKLSIAEANKIMKSLNTLSRALVDFSMQEKELPIDMYEALIKMSYMVVFLTHYKVQQRKFSDESVALIRQVHRFGEKVSSRFSQDVHRYGHCIHKNNVSTNEGMCNFYWSMLSESNKHENWGSATNKKLLERIEGLTFLQDQVDFLTHLTPCHPQNFEASGSLSASVHNWIAPLPLPLLAAYHNLGVKVSHSYFDRKNLENRNAPEAIQHDPESTLREFERALTKDEVEAWRKRVNDRSERSWDQDIVLRDSPFGGAVREKRIRELLKKQEEYIFRASEMGLKFSKVELTALLSLLRVEKPQEEVLAFIETHGDLLSNPAVRSFIQLIFFSPSLLQGVTRIWLPSLEKTFCRMAPQFLAKKIAAYQQKAEEKPSEIPTLLFLVQMSERLKGIYEVVGKEVKGEDCAQYDTKNFFSVQEQGLQTFLIEQRKKDPGSIASIEMIALQLQILFAKPKLSQEEMCQVILDMQKLKATATRVSSFDYRELFWIKGSYQELMVEMKNALDKSHLDYVLDAFCFQQNLLLDASPWSGHFPEFSNAQYTVNLETGMVLDRASNAFATILPGSIVNDSLYRKSFPDLLKEDVSALMTQMPDGTKVYFFQDLKNNPCRVEEKEGILSFYRSFSNALLIEGASFVNKPDQRPGWFEYVKMMVFGSPEDLSLPLLLQRGLFINPNMPSKGYVISSEGEWILEVELEQAKSGARIKNVIDLRGGQRSLPMQVVGLKDIKQPALKQLEQIENPRHILIWGKKGGSIEKIELTRYGLQFVIREGTLVCTTPKYEGYKVSFAASLEERKGFPFSLLLEHPDRMRPKMLFLPPAKAIIPGVIDAYPYYGLASKIWSLKTAFNFKFFGSIPQEFTAPNPHIKLGEDTLPLTTVALHPHTGAFIYNSDKEIQELILQAKKFGHHELALEVMRDLEIEKEDKAIGSWINFLGAFHKGGFDAAVGLKISENLFATIRGQKKYEKALEKLNSEERVLFQAYLKEVSDLTAPLRLSSETFNRLAGDLKSEDPSYYENHVKPFFLKPGETFTLPVQIVGGAQNPKIPEVLKTREQEKKEDLSEIKALENVVHPENSVSRSSLRKNLSLVRDPLPLLFKDVELQSYFNISTKELLCGETFLKWVLYPKKEALEKERVLAKVALEKLISTSTDPVEQLAIYAKEKRIASFSDLHMALLQKDFESLKRNNVLPRGLDLKVLEAAVIRFYDLEVRVHLITRSEAELSSMISEKGQAATIWAAKSVALWELLNYQRQYTISEYPELLAFETFHFVTFRNATHPSQLELLQQILASEASIVQAGTGTGKSSVLSVLRALMRANGTNLVTQKVLPHLYQETLALLKGRFGTTFHRKVFSFLYNQSMPLYDKEGNSLFERIYLKLLETIKNKGCVLTDYKSSVLLEQKFLILSKTISTDLSNGVETAPILLTHWLYLAKILILLKNREDLLMDEFDQPLSAVQRIQTQMKEGPLFPRWMIDESLFLFDLLLDEKPLMLEQNLQGDIPLEMRETCIRNVAKKIGNIRKEGDATLELITSYLVGESDEVLNKLRGWSDEKKDALAFLKDQCFTYLPLTLNRSGVSNYARSEDGKKIVTCSKGEKRQAKFGNPIEEINYSIQDYFQAKVALPSFRSWVVAAKKDWCADPQAAELRFTDVLPGVSLTQIVYLSPDAFEDRVEELLTEVNQKPEVVRFFLRAHLESLRTSGIVVSMNPQDSVAMSLAVSGVSATTGSLGSLHEQFQKDPVAAEKIEQGSIARLRKRSLGDPVRYDPVNPLALLKTINNPLFCALIDGGGAFRAFPPELVARALLAANPALKRVDFYDKEGNLRTVGDPKAFLAEKGFYFPQAQTRGSDQVLRPDGIAVMTATGKGDIEDFIQEAGRMRHDNQRVLVALSLFAPKNLNSLDDLIAHKQANKKAENGEDRYRAEMQRLSQIMRHAARQELLKTPDLEELEKLILSPEIDSQRVQIALGPFLRRFQDFESLFIQTQAATTMDDGQYFEKQKKLIYRNANPVEELQKLQNSLLARCNELRIVAPALVNYRPEDLALHMPEKVLPLSAADTQEQEVQEELELNNQQLVEQEEEQEKSTEVNPNKVESYLPREETNKTSVLANTLHRAFSPYIELRDPYLPLNRKDLLHRRKAFDDRTARVGVIEVITDGYSLNKIIIGDLLDRVERSISDVSYPLCAFRYDVRTGLVVNSNNDHENIVATPQFKAVIAQVKFLDGMTDRYTAEEIQGLSIWLKEKGVDEMRRFFSQTILKNRPENRFRHSQLWNLFEELQKPVTPPSKPAVPILNSLFSR